MTINQLVVEYKTSKSSKILGEIFKLLEKKIHNKAKHVFYQQRFIIPKSKREIKITDPNSGEKKTIISYKKINLSETKQVTIEDVEQELNLFLLELIERCELNKPFDTYFYSSIWFWIPKFINDNFFSNLGKISTFKQNEEGEEESIIDRVAITQRFEEPIDLNDLFRKLTTTEEKVLNILIKNPTIPQSEIAEKLKVTEGRVSQIFDSIRKKYKFN